MSNKTLVPLSGNVQLRQHPRLVAFEGSHLRPFIWESCPDSDLRFAHDLTLQVAVLSPEFVNRFMR